MIRNTHQKPRDFMGETRENIGNTGRLSIQDELISDLKLPISGSLWSRCCSFFSPMAARDFAQVGCANLQRKVVPLHKETATVTWKFSATAGCDHTWVVGVRTHGWSFWAILWCNLSGSQMRWRKQFWTRSQCKVVCFGCQNWLITLVVPCYCSVPRTTWHGGNRMGCKMMHSPSRHAPFLVQTPSNMCNQKPMITFSHVRSQIVTELGWNRCWRML